MEKVGIVVGVLLLAFGISLGVNLIMTPLVNWVIHMFNSGITLSFWQVYGLTFVIGLITGSGARSRSSSN